MGSMYVAMLLAGMGATLIVSVVFAALQQEEHRRNGLTGPDSRTRPHRPQ